MSDASKVKIVVFLISFIVAGIGIIVFIKDFDIAIGVIFLMFADNLSKATRET